MKKKLNLPNPLDNIEVLEDHILKEESNKIIKFKTTILDRRYYRNTDHYKIIDKALRSSVGKNWNEVREYLKSKIPQQYHYRIDDSVLYKNRNGQFIDEWGRIKKFLPTVKTSGPIYIEYYIENDIIKVYKPYVKFPTEKHYKVIKKKEKPVEKQYVFKFDYDIIDDWSNNLKTFIEILEANKKTYRIRRLDTVYGELKRNKTTGRWNRETRKELVITKIKTHYD